MKRTTWLILLALLICGSIGAQPRTAITIGASITTPNGPQFFVDGTSFVSPQVFEWIQGTTHVVQFPLSLDPSLNPTDYQSTAGGNIRFAFGGWTANTSLAPNLTGNIVEVTADPSLTTLTANVTVSYQLTINFPTGLPSDCNAAPPGTPPQTGTPEGVIYVDQQCIAGSTQIFLPAGVLTLAETAYPGWVFYGWLINGLPTTPIMSVNFAGPMLITPQFSVAKRVDILTNPIGLTVLMDGSPVVTQASYTPGTCTPAYSQLPIGAPAGFQPLCSGEFDLLPGSTHTIGAASPQSDNAARQWVFTGWSNGQGQNATYIPDSNTPVPAILTASFVPAVTVSILSNPGGMKIMVDGRDNWLNDNFIWGQGQTHTVAAETPQSDAHNRQWQFTGWSDQGAVSHTITIPANSPGFALAATYAEMGQLTINSSPSGLIVTVNGSSCPTPCVVNQISGSNAQISVAPSIPAGAGSRFNFTGWTDGVTSATRTVSFSQNAIALGAVYQTSFQLSATTNPANSGSFTAVPPSPDGFYANGTNVSVTAVANGGFKFAHWAGALAGSFNTGTVSMTSPQSVMGDFATVPFIPAAGIESVTGPTPDGSISPGSLVSIYGQNIATVTQLGPTSPLAQTLGATTITVGEYLLPLVFVSPGQINAQVPWELAPGTYSMAVHNTGLPDVTGNFTVTAYAPGVFVQPNSQNLPLVLALHANGTLINGQSPAVQGEQITIYGTGFGPYARPAVDGFPVSPAADYTIAGAVTVTCGASQTTPDFAGAVAGSVGISMVKLTITSDMAVSGNANLTISVNGKASASTILPIQ